MGGGAGVGRSNGRSRARQWARDVSPHGSGGGFRPSAMVSYRIFGPAAVPFVSWVRTKTTANEAAASFAVRCRALARAAAGSWRGASSPVWVFCRGNSPSPPPPRAGPEHVPVQGCLVCRRPPGADTARGPSPQHWSPRLERLRFRNGSPDADGRLPASRAGPRCRWGRPAPGPRP